jgi:hypothetical protein
MAEECRLLFDAIRIAVPSLFVILGWGVVHRLSIGRDHDKARREMLVKSVDSMIDDVDQLFKNALEYHREERDIQKELSIKICFQDLTSRTGALSVLCDSSSDLDACGNSLNKFKQAITRTHFEAEHERPMSDTDTQINNIADTMLGVKRAYMRVKHKQYAIA